ncbi:Serine/threonine-protein phosphatase 2A regulatory subunit B'' subunit beta [Phlyctochytrium bullatum]|nr:Serine/threonine-protein phosphatase 2A regulatory subunit B'' subunit beta [Phlyctochytrium bullatum]
MEDDINATRDFFSYKHFYVIYCKFWELDPDHDMFIEGEDLYRYDRHALTSLMIRRVLGGSARTLSAGKGSNRLSYKDFIWFLLSVEDKRTAGSIEYWFRCLDLDGDGIISLHELRDFYDEQFERMLEFRMSDPWKFEDLVCSLLDLIKPKNDAYITLSDLKRSTNAALFFDMVFDIRKYDMHIRRIDPAFREIDDVWVEERGRRIKLEGWDKFAERTYDELAQEERRSQSSCRSYGYASYEVEDLDEEWGEEEGDGSGWPTVGNIEARAALLSTSAEIEGADGTTPRSGGLAAALTSAKKMGRKGGEGFDDDDEWEDDEEEEEEEDDGIRKAGWRISPKVGRE